MNQLQNDKIKKTGSVSLIDSSCAGWVGGGSYGLAPGQAGGVVRLDVVLHLLPDGQVGLHPVHVGLVPAREPGLENIPNITLTSVQRRTLKN